jgi:hypothetical protein
VENWAEKTGLAIQPPTNIAEAMVQCEIRAHLAAMKAARSERIAMRARCFSFRVGVLLTALLIPSLATRMHAEEKLLRMYFPLPLRSLSRCTSR